MSELINIQDSDGTLTVTASGDWTLENAASLAKMLEGVESRLQTANSETIIAETSSIKNMDTSGAWLLLRLRKRLRSSGREIFIEGLSVEREVLLDEVIESSVAIDVPTVRDEPWKPLSLLGMATANIGRDIAVKINMLGRVVLGFFSVIVSPKRLRGTSIIHHLDQAGLRAVPIIALMSFVIGAIIAQQSAYQLRYFGAEVFTVDLVGILVLRELGVLLTAIMVAGRSGSAFTAEIGSMKMREEVDALRVIGLSTTDVLVLPRVLALIIALPLLTVLANVFALLGGGLVAWVYADIPPQEFIARLREAVWLSTLLVGFMKAPFMALIIATIACSEGFAVQGSAESLGRRTTASVVKAIFMVIVMDGLFAMFFASIGY
ncbi:MAG: MlaE family ABC transporter permease [Hyphomicrobiales bacterium]